MNRLVWIFIFCLCASSLLGQRYKEKHIKKDLQNLQGFDNAFIGFALYDPVKDKMLASHYADKHMTPASNTKLITLTIKLRISVSPESGHQTRPLILQTPQ